MRIHELKILPKYFERVIKGEKTFEIRKNDRDFQTGDEIELKEFDNIRNEFSGRCVFGRISYILNSGEYGLKQGYCVFSFKINKVAMEELK
ncbi:ASCH/PUA domain-containing protein [Terrisporobacter glycolicus]|uniref:DUF3850 domain-containing protein n=1 Tax=Terrisporobacter glycolicus ATCC 14880 = DSM 1288 TaxID=1121315 RepID=A0ABZ2EXC9_9FIRM|nr:ASCH/PUA domain-containing protein [Terrisporobacter glycolicus]